MFAQFMRSVTIFGLAARVLLEYLWLDFWSRSRSPEAKKAAQARAYRRWGALFRRAALRLQGLIVKVGQFLSTRVDVLPDSFVKELAQLQDAVPGASFPAIQRQVEAELGAPLTAIFAEFAPTPVAAASLGQVHKAVLREGHTVAVKVLRPGIERLIATDLAALRRITGFLRRFTRWGKRFDLPALMQEFTAVVQQEIDYRQEAEHMRQFRRNFRTFPGVDVPLPFDNLVARRVLVMEFIDGLRLTDRTGLLAAGLKPEALAQRLIDAYLKQALVDGFLHVDPHPGNFIARPDGTLVFIDFGMMDQITPADRANFVRLTAAALTHDLNTAVDAVIALGFVREGADRSMLRDALGFLLDRIGGVPLRQGPEMDAFLAELREWLYEEPLQFPAKYMFLGRAVGLLAGLASGLDPQIQWGDVLKSKALPLLTKEGQQTDEQASAEGFDWNRLLRELLGPEAAVAMGVAWEQVKTQGLTLLRLPTLVERALQQLESGSVRVTTDFSPLAAQFERLLTRLTWAVLAAGSGVAGALLRVHELMPETRVAWGISGAALFLLLLNLLRGGDRQGGGRAPGRRHRRRERA